MTVRELIEKLREEPPDREVRIYECGCDMGDSRFVPVVLVDVRHDVKEMRYYVALN